MRAYHVLGAAAIVAVLVFAGCEKTRRVEVQYRQQVVTMPAQPQPAPVQPQIGPVGPPPPPVVVPSTVTAADVVVETRGPVHEAFAEPVTVNPQPTFVIPQAPPQPVEEMPPDERPAGVNVVWIPGYWSWDDDRNGFVWISGIWRVPPPNCTWQPGYWAQTTGGYQWVSGYWMAQAVQEVVYLPAPPATLEAGPVGLAPSDDYLWVPGCWYWTTGRYAWRPGTWAVARSAWVWVPAHYIWTPRGYLFIDGHWDYTLERRGILFAPVYFARPVYLRPDYYYSPEVVIDTGSLTVCLFSRPAYCHYYFGDYYDAGYARRGIYPWYEYRDRHDWYDPIYSHEIWQHRRDDPKWRVQESAGQPGSPSASHAGGTAEDGRAALADRGQEGDHGPAPERVLEECASGRQVRACDAGSPQGDRAADEGHPEVPGNPRPAGASGATRVAAQPHNGATARKPRSDDGTQA